MIICFLNYYSKVGFTVYDTKRINNEQINNTLKNVRQYLDPLCYVRYWRIHVPYRVIRHFFTQCAVQSKRLCTNTSQLYKCFRHVGIVTSTYCFSLYQELALLHHSKRTATVTSQDTVQLLSIGREDFFDIFMSGDGEDNMPEHIRFVRYA